MMLCECKKICSKCLLSVEDTDSVWKRGLLVIREAYIDIFVEKPLKAPHQLINQMLSPVKDKNPVKVAAL